MNTLEEAAHALVERLRAHDRRVVFAESCTGGQVGSALTEIAGVSRWLCGSAVTYREATKLEWLKIDSKLIERHTAESVEVTEAMALRVLQLTPEASIGAAVTGHLGPKAPQAVDGVVFLAAAVRGPEHSVVETQRVELVARERKLRQQEASAHLLRYVAQVLDRHPNPEYRHPKPE